MAGISQRPPPATDIVESEELLQYISPALLKVNYDDSMTRIAIILGTFVFFSLLFVASLSLCSMSSTFRSLNVKHRAFLCLAVVRGIYGLACIGPGYHAIVSTTNLSRDVVFGKTATGAVSIFVTVGFFLFELSAVIISDIKFKTFSKLLITHHGLALIAYSAAVYLDSNFSFGCRGLLLEMSTPFSCMCFVLLKMGKEHSIIWKANQMLLIHTFHLRSVVEFYLWHVTYQNWSYIWNYMHVSIFVLLYSNLALVTFIMTPYWGYKKTQQLFYPVDWNFQESRNTDSLSNGTSKKIV